MERSCLESGGIPQLDQYQYAADHFGVIDFMDEAIFDQFIDLIRGENENETVANFAAYQGYDCHGQFFSETPPVELLDFDGLMGHNVADHDVNNDLGFLNACVKNVSHEEGVMDVEESSGTTTTTGTGSGSGSGSGSRRANKKSSSKVDRSRTLISERRRRGRMKEKLYALRSLVPTITKMDKASIVGDAVLYVRDLQMQVKKLKSEISSLGEGHIVQSTISQGRSDGGSNGMSFYPVINKIFKMDVFEVEERGFYVRIVCNKGRGIAALLYKALQSLTTTTFTLPTSNLAASAHNYDLTFTLHIMEGEMNIELQNMELLIASVFLKQGFELETSQPV